MSQSFDQQGDIDEAIVYIILQNLQVMICLQSISKSGKK
jgi:hypothetical protein